MTSFTTTALSTHRSIQPVSTYPVRRHVRPFLAQLPHILTLPADSRPVYVTPPTVGMQHISSDEELEQPRERQCQSFHTHRVTQVHELAVVDSLAKEGGHSVEKGG